MVGYTTAEPNLLVKLNSRQSAKEPEARRPLKPNIYSVWKQQVHLNISFQCPKSQGCLLFLAKTRTNVTDTWQLAINWNYTQQDGGWGGRWSVPESLASGGVYPCWDDSPLLKTRPEGRQTDLLTWSHVPTSLAPSRILKLERRWVAILIYCFCGKSKLDGAVVRKSV